MTAGSTVLITGAAGNMGGLLARHLLPSGHELRLMYHRTPLAADLLAAPTVVAVQADLGHPTTLPRAVEGVSVVVHFAGVLFKPRPETFLRTTNLEYFSNLLTAAIDAGVSRMILISFPQVEGPTSVEHPATGRLDRQYATAISCEIFASLFGTRATSSRSAGCLTGATRRVRDASGCPISSTPAWNRDSQRYDSIVNARPLVTARA